MKSALLSLLLSTTCGIACYLAAGNTLDLFLGGMLVAALIAGQSLGDWQTAPTITLGIASCWWIPVHANVITPTQWIACCGLLFTFIVMLIAATRALRPLSPIVASAIVTTLALAWLTWPIWLAGSLPGRQLHYAVLLHPLFAINHVLSDLGIWTEQQAAYGLTNLGQDVEYRLPSSAWPAIAMQTALATALLLLRPHWATSLNRQPNQR